ncbi:MAG: signal peptidase I, partial [Granulosicoccaceae bacterium]
MSFNLAWLLVSLTALSGVVWLVDKLLFANGRSLKAAEIAANDGAAKRDVELALEPWWVENARSFF